jgi:hypothetical protein
MEHYTEGRKYSHLSNAWILETSWNQSEEIAALRAQLASAQAENKELVKRSELLMEALWKASGDDKEFVNGYLESVGLIKDNQEVNK